MSTISGVMNKPLGRLEALEYREAAFPMDNGRVGAIDVLRIHFRAPDGNHYEFDLNNGGWQLSNRSLQFLAKFGYRPSDIGDEDRTMRECYDDQQLIPIAVDGDGYGLAQSAMQGAQEALENAEWFDPEDETGSTDGRAGRPNGGGGPDPGTGNRGGVEPPTYGDKRHEVSIEMADEDSDAGITVEIE